MNRRGVAKSSAVVQPPPNVKVNSASASAPPKRGAAAIDVGVASRDSPRSSAAVTIGGSGSEHGSIEIRTPPNTVPSSPRNGGGVARGAARSHATGFGARAGGANASTRSQRGHHHSHANDELQRQRALALSRFRFMVAVWCARFLTKLRHGLIVRRLRLHIQNVIEPRMAFRLQCAFRRFQNRKLQRMRNAAKKIVLFLRPRAMQLVVLKVLTVSKLQRLGRGLIARSHLANLRATKVRRILRHVLSRPLKIMHAKNVLNLLRSLKDERDLFVTQAVVAAHAIVREQRLAFQRLQSLKFDVVQDEKKRLRAALDSLALFEKKHQTQRGEGGSSTEDQLSPLKSLVVEIPTMSHFDEYPLQHKGLSTTDGAHHHPGADRSISISVAGKHHMHTHSSSVFLDSSKPLLHSFDGNDVPGLRESLSACLKSITGVFAPVMSSSSSTAVFGANGTESSIFSSSGRGAIGVGTFRAFPSAHEYDTLGDDTHRLIEDVFHRPSAASSTVGVAHPTPIVTSISSTLQPSPQAISLSSHASSVDHKAIRLGGSSAGAISPSETTPPLTTPTAAESPEYGAAGHSTAAVDAQLPSLLEDTTSTTVDLVSTPPKGLSPIVVVEATLVGGTDDERSPIFSRAPTLNLRVASASSMLLPPSINGSGATPSPLRGGGGSSYAHSSQHSSCAPSPRVAESDYDGSVTGGAASTASIVDGINAFDVSPRASVRGLNHGSFALTPAPPMSRSTGSISAGSPHPSSAASFRGLSRRKSSRFGASASSHAQLPLDDVQLAFAALLEQTESIERKAKEAEMRSLLKAMQSHVAWCIEVIRFRDFVPRPFVSLLPHLSPSWVLHSAMKLFDTEVEERGMIIDEYEATPLLFLGRPIMGSNSERRRKRMKELLHQRAEKLFEAFVGFGHTAVNNHNLLAAPSSGAGRTTTPSALRRGTLAAAALRAGVNLEGSILSPTEAATIAAFGGLSSSTSASGLPSIHAPYPPTGATRPTNRPNVHVSLSSRTANDEEELGSLSFQEYIGSNSTGATSMTDSVPLISPRGAAATRPPAGRFREIDTSRTSIFCGSGGLARSPGGAVPDAWKTPRSAGVGGAATRLLSATEALVPGVFADRKGTFDGTGGGATPLNAFRSAARSIVSPRSARQAFFEDESEKSVSQRNAALPVPQAPSKRVTFTSSSGDALGGSLNEDNATTAFADHDDLTFKGDDIPAVRTRFSGADFQMGIGQSWHVAASTM